MYGFAMILWYLAARKTEPFLPLQKERAFMAIVDGKVSYMCTLLRHKYYREVEYDIDQSKVSCLKTYKSKVSYHY